MEMYKRIFVIVLDSLGIGAMPDAARFADEGADTFGHILEKTKTLNIPNLRRLGFLNLKCGGDMKGVESPEGRFMRMREASNGKDTMTGHWEMMGIKTEKPFRTFTEHGFPAELIKELEQQRGKKVIGNKSASGTEIIEELGEEEIRTGSMIVYTSADSVMQICGNEETFDLEELYRCCETARRITMKDEWRVGRVIARPYIGMKKGETKDLDLTFPKEYSSEELAGQEVVFKVTLQSFKRAPELTDTWVAKNTDCKSVDDYKKEIRTTLEDEAKTSAQNTLRETAWNTVLSASEVKEYPQEDLDTAKTEFRSLYENYAKQGDMTLEDFVKAQGISMDDFEEQSGQYAEFKVKQNLIVQGIMDAENMTLEDKKSLSIQDELIKAYSVKDLAALVDKYGQAAVDESIGLLRVEDFILDNATVEEKVSAGDTQGVNGDDPSSDGSSAEGTVDEELEAAEATDMVPEDGEADQDADSSTSDAAGQE